MATTMITQAAAVQVRRQLARQGRSQEWLSEQTGIPMRTLARRLHRTNPSQVTVEELAVIAAALRVRIVDLIPDAAVAP